MNAPEKGLAVEAPAYVKNPTLDAWISDMDALCKPDAIHWCDGSTEEYDRLCQQMVDAGTFKRLNPAKRPNSYLATSSPSDALLTAFSRLHARSGDRQLCFAVPIGEA